MDTEIELKVLVAPVDLEALTDWMNQRPEVMKHYQKQLSNNYFDTPVRQLREMDCGLRVRTIDGRSEQTLKTAGRVIGGLHQRPEYNLPIDGLRPDLYLFPLEIWPEDLELTELQHSLTSMFSTDFRRKTWLLSFADEAMVEVVLDVGEISTGDDSVPICEMEFELVKGSASILFEFARQLTERFHIRLGQASKAARGYRLMDGKKQPELPALPTLTLTANESVEAALVKLVSEAVRHIQTSEDVFFATSSIHSLQEIRHGLLWLLQIRHYFIDELGDELLSVLAEAKHWLSALEWVEEACYRNQILVAKDQYMKKLGDKKLIRKALKSQDDSEQVDQAKAMLVSVDYSQWFLRLSQWLVCSGWRTEGEAQPELELPVGDLARRVLDYSSAYVERRFPAEQNLSAQMYAEGCERLERALFCGYCFRRVFEPDAKTGYRNPWHDMLKGCHELALLHYLEQVADNLELTEPEAFERWLNRKRESWVELIEQSKQSAFAMAPYWH